jgi:hypothetical protein
MGDLSIVDFTACTVVVMNSDFESDLHVSKPDWTFLFYIINHGPFLSGQ